MLRNIEQMIGKDKAPYFYGFIDGFDGVAKDPTRGKSYRRGYRDGEGSWELVSQKLGILSDL